MAYAVGATVELELTLPGGTETASGVVFAYDAATDRLVLRQPGSTPFHSSLRILKGEHVTNILQLKPAAGPAEPLPAVDLQRCREREDKAVRAAEAEAAKIGVGVTRQAQVRTGLSWVGCALFGAGGQWAAGRVGGWVNKSSLHNRAELAGQAAEAASSPCTCCCCCAVLLQVAGCPPTHHISPPSCLLPSGHL